MEQEHEAEVAAAPAPQEQPQPVPAAGPLPVMCFTDVLCVFCYVADIRFEKLKADFRGKVELAYHFIPVYGDVMRRIAKSGKSFSEYGAAGRDIGDRFPHVEIHPDVFRRNVPRSCVPAHLYLCAVKLLQERGALGPTTGPQSPFEALMWSVRVAFFRDVVDVSSRSNLDALARGHGIPIRDVAALIDDGQAFAELSHDVELQRTHKVPVSPSLVFNEGRQLLNGNVGYRVIEANIRELLNKPTEQGSWY